MPVFQVRHISEHLSFCIWKIEENADLLKQKVRLSKQEREELKNIQHVKRIKEWLGARAALREISQAMKITFKGTVKDEHKKPHLVGLPYHMSLSHSFPYAAAMVNKQAPCGIDIEKPKPALFHVSNRFLSDKELVDIGRNPGHLCAAWAAKEVLLKIYGRKKLSFKNNIRLSPFELKPHGNIVGHIDLEMGTGTYTLEYFQVEDFVICYSAV